MKKYKELNEELQQEARRWQPIHYEKWTYSVQDGEIVYCRIENKNRIIGD